MSDRFKFRVWSPKKKKYLSFEEYNYQFVDNDGELFLYPEAENFDCNFAYGDEIVEQCTGLKAKDGRLIYEGDIIFINGEKWCVIWNDEDCAFFFSNLKEVYHQPIFPDFYMMTDDFKVIGNIHENPELMK